MLFIIKRTFFNIIQQDHNLFQLHPLNVLYMLYLYGLTMFSKDNSLPIRKTLSWIYFLLAIAGLIFPTLANIDFMMTYGPSFDIVKFGERYKISNLKAFNILRYLEKEEYLNMSNLCKKTIQFQGFNLKPNPSISRFKLFQSIDSAFKPPMPRLITDTLRITFRK